MNTALIIATIKDRQAIIPDLINRKIDIDAENYVSR